MTALEAVTRVPMRTVVVGTAAILAFSVTLVLAIAEMDSDLVSTRAGQRSVDLGRPFVWIHQDQTGYDPPLPTRLGLASPWENPTSVSATGFLLDVLILFTLTAVLVAGARAFRTGRRAVDATTAQEDAQPR